MKTWVIYPGATRNSDIKFFDSKLCDELDRLAADGKAAEVSISEYSPRLPGNLQARISILIRELAQFCGYSEYQMKQIIKQNYYPSVIIHWRETTNDVPKSTMQLTPAEAREIENHLYTLGAEIGCPLSIPQADSAHHPQAGNANG